MRYGIISDIHSNIVALEAVLKEIGLVDGIITLGDLVGYGPNPNECIERIREVSSIVIMGNHDQASIDRMDLDWFNEDARRAIIWTAKTLIYENRRYLEDLPMKERLLNFEIVHGSLRNPLGEYILSSFEAIRTLELLERDLLFFGHTHLPSIFYMKEGRVYGERLKDQDIITIKDGIRKIINVGSVGQPRDGDPRASFGIIDSELNQVQIKRIPYDIESVQKMMKKEGLPDSLIMRLSFGL